MQLLPTFTTFLLILASSATASPTPVVSAKRACTTIYPTLQVPVDFSAPNRVYGSSSEVTVWKNSSGNRNMLFKFNIPVGSSNCKLKFHAIANPPISISGTVTINAYTLTSTFVSSTSWNSKPARAELAGTADISVSNTAPTEQTVVTQACTSGIRMPIMGSI
ncbi:hypothetical protein BGX38DRAFT_1167186 [Terfezia claveryi]|nr:hypothetical protein BGX38DRAFT_1167186 [Terfezia claveryi]